MNLSMADNVQSSLDSTPGEEFISTSDVTMDPPEMENLETDFHLINDTIKSPPRTAYSGASSSEVFTSTFAKQHGKRPQSARPTPSKAPYPKKSLTPLSNIPLPVKSSGPIKTPSLLKNTRSSTKTSSMSVSRTCTVANKHTLEIQFINKNKRYLQMKKELIEKQKPVIDLYQNLVQIKKRLEELGKLVTLESIKLVPFTDYKQPFKIEGGGEQVPTEIITEMKSSVEEIPKTLTDVCRNLLSRRAVIVELLEKLANSEVDSSSVNDRIAYLKSEGQHLQESLDAVIANHKEKINELVANWKTLLSVQKTSTKVSDLEHRLKEQERLAEESIQTINDLKKKLEEKKSVYDRSVSELNGIIHSLKDQIKKLEHDLEVERKTSFEVKSRNTTNSQNVKSMRAKMAELEGEKKASEALTAEMQRKIRHLQDQLKNKESQWNKDKEEMAKKLKHQDSTLQKLSTDKTEYENTLEAMEEQKVSTEEELRNTIETLNEQLQTTKTELQQVTSERNEALGKCAAFEGYIARMGFECKEEMNKVCCSIEWGNIKNSATPEMEKYMVDLASELQISELQDTIRKMEEDQKTEMELAKQKKFDPTEIKKQYYKQQEYIDKYKKLLEESERKLREKSTEISNLRSEITQLKVRQEALEEQNYSCPTDDLQRMVEEGRQKLTELMKKSIESEQKLEHYAHVIERQTQQMSEMENLLRYRENMAGVLKASRDELVLEKESLTRYSQEMRTVLAEVTKEGKMKDRLIKELQEKIELREHQISKLDKEVREMEANLMLTNEKRFKLQETIGYMEKELQSTKAHINQLADINSRNGRPKLKPF